MPESVAKVLAATTDSYIAKRAKEFLKEIRGKTSLEEQISGVRTEQRDVELAGDREREDR